MKGIAVLTFAALGIALAGCGAGHQTPSPAATVTITISPQGTPAASPEASSPDSATANERMLVDGLAASISVIPARVVAGPLMRAYARFENAYRAALGAVGNPSPSGTVTKMTGGFKLCYPATGSYGPSCEAVTQFTTNQAGQVTGVSVKGQPVASRIATAPDVPLLLHYLNRLVTGQAHRQPPSEPTTSTSP
jgi:hypothetical protein